MEVPQAGADFCQCVRDDGGDGGGGGVILPLFLHNVR